MAQRSCPTCRRDLGPDARVCPHDGTPLAAPPNPLIGAQVAGRYRVVKRVGEGGMGEVYLALHEAIEKKVAIKVLKAEYSRKADVAARFLQEARSSSRVKHPSVVDVFDFGQLEDGRFFLVLEFLEGHDLAAEVVRRGRLPVSRVVELMLQVAGALAAAHESGVVHRDMKPENIFLEGERAKIVDFGIAKVRELGEAAFVDAPTELGAAPPSRKLTKAGTVFGTPEYMAPEQASGKDVDGRADVYACGCILYELLCGKVPFQGDSVVHTLTLHITEPVPPLRSVAPWIDLSPALEALVARALEKDPARRFASMRELGEALAATPEGREAPSRSLFAARGGTVPIDPHAGASVKPIPLVAVRSRTSAGVRAETVAEIAPRRRSGKALGVVAVLVAGAAVAVYVGMTARRDGATAPPAPLVSPPVRHEPPPPPAPSSVVASAAPPPVAPAQTVKLRVVTEPEGAVVKKGGFQVCDASPCDVLAQPHEAAEITAEKGELRGALKVLAQQDQTLTLKLTRPAAPSSPPATTTAGAKGAGGRGVTPVPMCEVMEGDLKILRPCK